jgi:DtxR family Mn-dependent transcriptional regulator
VSERIATGESGEMYLKTIAELTTIEPLVPISALADRLGISVVSATEMVHRMCDQGLLEHKRYKGVRLTKDGKREALDIIRRHRLWERFLVDHLKMAWEDSHDIACQLEHAAGPEVIEAMDAFLGRPTHCPHGNPIPTAEGTIHVLPGLALDTLKPGEHGIVLLIRPETNPALSYLVSHGIRPGVPVTVKSINNFDHLWCLDIAGQEQILSKAMVSRIVVRMLDDPTISQKDEKEVSSLDGPAK